MSEHENSIDIDGLCCTECFYQGRIAERERIIALLTTEMFAMRESRSPDDWRQSYGIEIAIGLIDGGHE